MGTIISTVTSEGITLSSQSDSPVTIDSASTINASYNDQAALYAVGGGGYDWTIVNSGKVLGGLYANGINLGSGEAPLVNGVIINQAGGTISGYYNAVSEYGPASITNAAGGLITAAIGTALLLHGSNTVVNQGSIFGSDKGINAIGSGVFINQANATISGSYIAVQMNAPGTVTNAGLIDGGAYSVLFTEGQPGNAVVVDPGASFKGEVSGGYGVLELAVGDGSAGSLSSFGSSGITNFDTLLFDPNAQWTVTGDMKAGGVSTTDLVGFLSSDTIDLTGFPAATYTFASNALILTDASGNKHDTLHIQGKFTTSDFHIVGDGSGGTVITTDAACYAAGTRILTPNGEVPIEHLAIGDLVIARSGVARPIKWIGRRGYDGAFIAGNRNVLPIRITADALGDGVPGRTLDVSPKHALLIDDVLVPAELLVNGISIWQRQQVERVEYYHIELDSHDAVFAEGTMAETFVDCDSRGMFQNAADFRGDPGPSWQFCAPRLDADAVQLGVIRRRLAARAASRQHTQFGGNIDVCDWRGLSGWAFEAGQRVRLEISYDGEVKACIIADGFRHDLEATGGLGDGCCSFSIVHPPELDRRANHLIEIRRIEDGVPVPGSPVRLAAELSAHDCCAA